MTVRSLEKILWVNKWKTKKFKCIDLSYSILSVLYQKVTRYTCSRVFKTTVLLLSTILTPIVSRWPSREEINNNLLKCFSDFKPTRVVLNCTEVPIERSKCLRCRIRCYSYPTYGGRESDQLIFTKSELLDRIISGTDGVMVDKGFLIQATYEETVFSKNIAAARVHIERVNQRIKIFKMLKNHFPWSLLDY
ncbi:uncharacterized protein LOC117178600 [Belonocnema kinseyi]|uniref:uncharacterized protein LOC117178600 n=1 Tax=Belonocnema kinseyi TaxID=2817044 RepID=UPI00143DCFA0|nr:uncharacterized protein LOC117178600 [Belonocnema kinseyi]